MSQDTETGVAVAVTDVTGTEAVDDTGPHDPDRSHNHVGTPTTWNDAGLIRTTGFGRTS
ncbi:hypothetical protein [Streptacidiphilus monticola]|uniref:Uncharacterized protein n=1 Tax=Streptacidiphilus monticola TaxID=2161674 RepID=A0ABW1G940_9ACTN